MAASYSPVIPNYGRLLHVIVVKGKTERLHLLKEPILKSLLRKNALSIFLFQNSVDALNHYFIFFIDKSFR
jgi:hypothetical protein